MKYQMFQIAIYGKGGIGKSTISANLSYLLAKKGHKTMQIGCDPKHDSTRLLLGGKAQKTVLQYVRETPFSDRKLEDVLVKGDMGVLCAEAGGPEPGIGCAGRGILTTFDELRRLGSDAVNVDVKIYDVLGDVVCGGFAVPLREGYADGVLIVTSGEFMSMYAANNILKGLKNFDTGSPRVIGLVLNCRGMEGESETVNKFAKAVGMKVVASINRDSLFADAESEGRTLASLFQDSVPFHRLDAMADYVISVIDKKTPMSNPIPLDDDQLSDLAAGRPIRKKNDVFLTNNCKGCRKTISGTRIMNSCAAYGAAAAYMKIRDCAVLLHGPDSCRYVMGVFRGKAMDAAYSKNLYDGNQTQNLFTTSMENGDSIFGGISKLEEKANELLKTYNTLAIVTTCMPGIIGDDCRGLVKKLKETHPDSNIILIPTDGDVKGDFNDGFYMAIDSMMDLVAPCKEKRNTVNLIGSSFYNIRSKTGFTETRRMLSLFGLNIGCMFLEETDMESVIKFNESMVDIKLSDLFGTKEIANIVSNRTGRTIFPYCLPIGLYDYQEWLYAMGELTNKKEIALKEIEASKEKYNMFLKRKSILEGKRIAIYSRMGTNLDWLLDVLKDIGSDILFLGYQNDIPMSRYSDIATANISPESVADIVKPFNPHLILGDYPFPIEKVKYTGVWKIEPGLDSVFRYVEYLEDVLKLPDYGGWNND